MGRGVVHGPPARDKHLQAQMDALGLKLEEITDPISTFQPVWDALAKVTPIARDQRHRRYSNWLCVHCNQSMCEDKSELMLILRLIRCPHRM